MHVRHVLKTLEPKTKSFTIFYMGYHSELGW